MTESREFNAATVEQAVTRAAANIGVPEDQLRFQVVDEGSTGFLGIGARDARIVVESPEELISAPASLSDEAGPDLGMEKEVAPVDEREQPTGVPETTSDAVAEDAPDELIIAVDEFITSLLRGMNLDATVDAYDAGDVIAVDVATRETGLFVGRKGETIDAVQYLSNVVVYKNRPYVKKIVVDSEGYRQRRVEALEGMAHRAARRAVREKRSLDLPPMASAERRVVHLYLKDTPGVTTSSEGEDEHRRVIVSPV